MKLTGCALISVAFAMSIATANAQTTDCTVYGNNIQCRTNRGIDASIPLRAGTLSDYTQANRERRELQERQREAELAASYARSEAQGRADQARLAQMRREAIGSYLQQGDCQGAVRFALAAGDIELATQARSFCEAAPAAPLAAPAQAAPPPVKAAVPARMKRPGVRCITCDK